MAIGYRFEFNLDPKKVRYLNWDKTDDLKYFTPPYLFRTILRGSVCARQLANRMEKFLKWLLIRDNEYKIEVVETEETDIVRFKPVKYDKISQEMLREFRIVYKSFARGYLDVSDSIVRHSSRADSDLGEEKFFYAQYPIKVLKEASKKELELVTALSIAANEITCLTRLMLLSRKFMVNDGKSFDLAVTQERTILHILAGKNVEAWEMITKKYFASKLSLDFNSKISEDSQEFIKKLKKYFKSQNILRKTRNEFAFHYGDSIVSSKPVTEWAGKNFTITNSGYFFNTVYGFVELHVLANLASEFDTTLGGAINSLREDVELISTMICLLCQNIINVLLYEIAKRSSLLNEAQFEKYTLEFDSIMDWEGLPTVIHPDEAVRIASQLDQLISENASRE